MKFQKNDSFQTVTDIWIRYTFCSDIHSVHLFDKCCPVQFDDVLETYVESEMVNTIEFIMSNSVKWSASESMLCCLCMCLCVCLWCIERMQARHGSNGAQKYLHRCIMEIYFDGDEYTHAFWWDQVKSYHISEQIYLRVAVNVIGVQRKLRRCDDPID